MHQPTLFIVLRELKNNKNENKSSIPHAKRQLLLVIMLECFKAFNEPFCFVWGWSLWELSRWPFICDWTTGHELVVGWGGGRWKLDVLCPRHRWNRLFEETVTGLILLRWDICSIFMYGIHSYGVREKPPCLLSLVRWVDLFLSVIVPQLQMEFLGSM